MFAFINARLANLDGGSCAMAPREATKKETSPKKVCRMTSDCECLNEITDGYSEKEMKFNMDHQKER
jgi:hypothetical protein